MKRVIIFDLDETVVDSSHRTPNNPDGTLNLAKYLEQKTRENTLRDTLLPLADFWRSLCMQDNYIVVCTARTWADFDAEFLEQHNLKAHKILARFTEREKTMRDAELKAKHLRKLFSLRQFQKVPKYMFDDAKPVIKAMRQMNIVCMNAHKVNARLAA